MRVLLTGATGLIGSAVLAALGSEGHEVAAACAAPARAAGSPLRRGASPSTSPQPSRRQTGCCISSASTRSSIAPAYCRTARAIRQPACMWTGPPPCSRPASRWACDGSCISPRSAWTAAPSTAFARSKLAGDQALMGRDLDWVILGPPSWSGARPMAAARFPRPCRAACRCRAWWGHGASAGGPARRSGGDGPALPASRRASPDCAGDRWTRAIITRSVLSPIAAGSDTEHPRCQGAALDVRHCVPRG